MVLKRVFSGRMRQFIRKRLNRERMIDVGHRPEPPNPHMRRGRPVFGTVIRNREREVREAQSQFTRVRINRIGIERRPDRRKHGALQPGGWLSIRAQRGLHVHRRNGMVRVKLDVILAAPDDLHRLPGFLREYRRFHRVIRERFPSKCAAQQGNVYRDVFLLRPHGCGDGIARAHGALRRRPSLYFSVAVNRQRRRRLHRSMRQQRRVILGFDDFSALRKRGVHVSYIPHDFSGLSRGLLQFPAIRGGVENPVRALFPIDLQFSSSLHCRPGIVCKHGHAAERLKQNRRFESVDGGRLFYTRNSQRGLVVQRFHGAAQHRRMHHAGVQHPIHMSILPKGSFARAQVLQVITCGVFSDVPPLAARLEFQLFFLRHFQFCRRRRQFTVSQLLPGLFVRHGVQFCGALSFRNVPLLCRCAHQHQPCGSTRLA